MEIRRLYSEDAAAYWDLRIEALQTSPDAFITTYEDAVAKENPIAQAADRMTSKNNFTYGAFINSNLVGTVTMLRQSHKKFSHKADILAMYVSPHSRGKNIGKWLLQQAIEDARQTGIEQLLLGVVSTNEPAVRLYQSLGFMVFGTEKNAIKDGSIYFDEYMMVLFLT
ncbi:GNAT family N-acetyltransferase [Thalassobacillus devorans]|uniref:GNAT family N-acetyltransferase n=1 Tax=Thalassobacillus devorans TaxID=279813 RepID=UPI000A1CE542|nr:GNAT family N-acetyltransferase [Thalassobacillus devorans]